MFQVPNSLIKDQKYSHLDVTVWLYANFASSGNLFDSVPMSGATIVYLMRGVVGNAIQERVSESIKYLVDTGALQGNQLNKNLYAIDKQSFQLSSHYTLVSYEAIQKIMTTQSRPYSLIRHYLLLLSLIDQSTKCGNWSSESIADILGEDATTLTPYYKKLEELELLCFSRAVKRHNLYCRPEDKDILKNSGGAKLTLSSNVKRRMTLMYNEVKRGNTKYTSDPLMMDELQSFCERMNSEAGEDLYDMSIFT